MMGRMTVWSQTLCTSKFPLVDCRQKPAHQSPAHHHTLCLCFQHRPEEDCACLYVFWVSVSAFLETLVPSLKQRLTAFASFSTSVFGVVLILVDFVLVVVDISLYDRSREVGDALEAVSLLISFFFLADVLLRVYVEG